MAGPVAVAEPVLRRRRLGRPIWSTEGYLHPDCAKIFQTGKTEGGTSCDGQPIRFYRHQRDAIMAARGGDSYVLTTGTGSGKSLSYIVPIVDRVLRARAAATGARRSGRSSSTR